jgi:hypothetical protein
MPDKDARTSAPHVAADAITRTLFVAANADEVPTTWNEHAAVKMHVLSCAYGPWMENVAAEIVKL